MAALRSCSRTKAIARRTISGACVARCRHQDRRGADWRADQRKPGPVEDKRLIGFQDDVVRVARLRDPQRAAERPHREALAVADFEDLAGFEMERYSAETRIHDDLLLHEDGACDFMGRNALPSRWRQIAPFRGGPQTNISHVMHEFWECRASATTSPIWASFRASRRRRAT